MEMVTARDALHERVLDATYPIWGEGLSRRAYGAWNRAQMETDWGRSHLDRLALVDGETLLSSAKRYRLSALMGSRLVRILGIGAVFTPPDFRGKGYGRVLVERMIRDAEREGHAAALLFSEIGAAYYEQLGFRVVPRTLLSVDVERRDGAPATFVRAGEDADLPALAELSAAYAAKAGFALDRSPALVGFGIARRRLLAGLGPAGRRATEFFVAEEGHRAVAYVLIARGPEGAVLLECGDRDPSGARIGAILQVLRASTPAEPAAPMAAWLPPFLRPPQVRVLDEHEASEVMMIRPFADVPSSVEDLSPVVYWQTDVF